MKDELIVKFRDEIAEDESLFQTASSNAHSQTGASVTRTFKGLIGTQLIKIPGHVPLHKALKKYLDNPDIQYAEPNYIVHASLSPDDPDFSNLWGLHNTGQTGGTSDADIDAPEAWDLSTGSSGVIIAVVDSGVAIDSNISVGHPELLFNVWTNQGETDCADNVDNDNNGYIDDCYGWDFLDNDNDPMDYNGHGTHVAGTIASLGNNNQGITGVMWSASVMPLRFLDASGSGSTADAVSAILYANAHGADVINNSWGGGGFSQTLEDAINASDAVVVCAAGNSGRDNDSTPFYPASYTSPNIISVAATDHNDNLAWFSNYGESSVDIAAPGVNIYSTVPARNDIFFDNMTDLDNWTADPPWGLSSTYYSSPYSASDSPSGDYANNTNSSLALSDPLNLSDLRGTSMTYMMRLETETDYDFLCIDVSGNGRLWFNHICWHGSTGSSFYFMEEDFTTHDDDKKFYVRFRLDSNSVNTYDGAYIDDVHITTYSDIYTGSEYAYYNGTSMAAPHVSGTAGLLRAMDPEISIPDIINAILNNADPVSSLSDKVSSGGRLNAYNALYYAPCANLPVRIADTGLEFSTIQEAYDASVSGDVIMSHAVLFSEDLYADTDKQVTLEGGYDCYYTSQTGTATLNGDLFLTSGTLIMGDFIIQ